ncbi:unnamed protein product [Linum tenue]|uniref:Uncharacterized protein n=1 Tax=Linum tenue TaxID=586396 RepID=A0AAV0IHR8_9ROSI|nr:unnamed protein product [Linum tenue]
MSVLKLLSNKQFITRDHRKECSDVEVVEYAGDPRDFGMVDLDARSWGHSSVVGPSAEAKFEALEVFGVTIGGEQLKELVEDLKVGCSKDESHYLMVNRQGLCLLHAGGPSIAWLRLNDRFGWSKYGVRPAIETGTIWSVWDMSSGAVLVAPPLGRRGGEDTWEKVVEEKEKEMEEKESLLRKTLEEKEKEVVSLRAALNALTTTQN